MILVVYGLYIFTHRRQDDVDTPPSAVATMLRRISALTDNSDREDEEQAARNIAGIAYAGAYLLPYIYCKRKFTY